MWAATQQDSRGRASLRPLGAHMLAHLPQMADMLLQDLTFALLDPGLAFV
jgi:hypothetical protein